MFETYLSLVVPADRQLREDIRQKTEHYFTMNKIAPPVSYNKLADLSDLLLTLYNWERSNKAFVMVCCGNAIWRSVVGAIPYNRRMLLLPQCLKNSNMCMGKQDELGLLCSECGNCNISGFLREAENLGYLTIVSEGTTIATRLVESGKVDAIIGVGCMEVLQKMFLAVNKYSVPGIGVPLLTCGCIDTTADAEWIKEEIHHLENNKDFRLINLNDLKDRTTLLFNRNLIDQFMNLKQTPTDNIVREIMLAGGKRIRPLLTSLAYEALCKKPDPEILKHLTLSVECFHKASLIHDDIEDNDAFRYGRETIHIRYGIPVAINIGDLLIGEGYRLISDCGLNPQVTMKCIKMVSRGHKAMSVGQGDELLARRSDIMVRFQDMLNIFENKTAAAFRVSLLLGAIAAEAGEETLEVLERFSNLVGITYQVKDDLEDISTEKDFSHLRNPSVLISLLTENAIQSDSDRIPEVLNKDDLQGLQVLFKKYAIAQLTADLIRDYLRRIDSCLVNIQNIQLKLALYEIVGKTFRDYL